jgi:hypothetical protein
MRHTNASLLVVQIFESETEERLGMWTMSTPQILEASPRVDFDYNKKIRKKGVLGPSCWELLASGVIPEARNPYQTTEYRHDVSSTSTCNFYQDR